MPTLKDISGIGPATIGALAELGVNGPETLASADPARLTQARGITPARAEAFISAARALVATQPAPENTAAVTPGEALAGSATSDAAPGTGKKAAKKQDKTAKSKTKAKETGKTAEKSKAKSKTKSKMKAKDAAKDKTKTKSKTKSKSKDKVKSKAKKKK